METTKLLFEWTNVKPDPIQFKPYSPEFAPVGIYVEVEIPNRYLINSDQITVITPRGMAYAISKLARAIRNIQNGDDDDESGS